MKSMSKSDQAVEIKKALLDAKVTQAEIARELGVSGDYVSVIITGRYLSRGPGSDRVREAICRKTGRTMQELWGTDPIANLNSVPETSGAAN